MFVRCLSAAILAALSCNALAAADLYDAINRMRAGEGACRVAPKAAPLTRQPALERAARSLAGGQPLRESLKEAGYRATASRYIGITGSITVTRAAEVLESKYCEQLLDRSLVEIGIHHDATRLLIVMAAPFAPRVTLSPEVAAQRVLELVNDARTQPRRCGDRSFAAARPVSRSAVLGKAARIHAEDMVRHNFFGHTGHDGSSVADRVRRVGYRFRTAGENIAGGATTPEEAVAGWIRSPGHCANLMNPFFSEMGVAYAVARNTEYGVYWTQVFAAPR